MKTLEEMEILIDLVKDEMNTGQRQIIKIIIITTTITILSLFCIIGLILSIL